jgi:hypothetical protein
MRDNKVIQTIAGLVTAGAVVAMVFAVKGGFPPRVEVGPHDAAGWAMARQTISFLQPGGQVMIITRTTAESPAMNVLVASFKREIRKSGATIAAEKVLDVDPLRPVEAPPGAFIEAIRKLPPGSVIVSFVGPPLLSAEQRKQLREIKSAIVAFCPGNWPERVNFQTLFKEGLLRAAVVSRRDQRVTSTKPADTQAWFDQNYKVITDANVSELAFTVNDSR